MKQRVIIMGAAGRDFHNFNVHFRDDPQYEVVAFTATQIPDIAGGVPAGARGAVYPEGSRSNPRTTGAPDQGAEGGPGRLRLQRRLEPVRHGALRSGERRGRRLHAPGDRIDHDQVQAARHFRHRRADGIREEPDHASGVPDPARRRGRSGSRPPPHAVRRPRRSRKCSDSRPRGSRPAPLHDRGDERSTSPTSPAGTIVYAGVDYEKILRKAEEEADVVVWDGGNNDFSFYRPDLSIVVADPHRAGHELLYYPSAVNVRTADVVVINKVDTACLEDIRFVRENVTAPNPRAWIVEAASPILVDNPGVIRGRASWSSRTVPRSRTAGWSSAQGRSPRRRYGAQEIVDPARTRWTRSPRLTPRTQRSDGSSQRWATAVSRSGTCRRTVDAWSATASSLERRSTCSARLFKRPVTRVRYELQEIGSPRLRSS